MKHFSKLLTLSIVVLFCAVGSNHSQSLSNTTGNINQALDGDTMLPPHLRDTRYKTYVKKRPLKPQSVKSFQSEEEEEADVEAKLPTAFKDKRYKQWVKEELKKGNRLRRKEVESPTYNVLVEANDLLEQPEKRKVKITGRGVVVKRRNMATNGDDDNQVSTAKLGKAPKEDWEDEPDFIETVVVQAPTSNAVASSDKDEKDKKKDKKEGKGLSVASVEAFSIDSTPPEVTAIKTNGKTLLGGDFIAAQPVITATFTDAESDIATWNMKLLDSSQMVVASTLQSALTQHQKTATGSLTVTAPLSAGKYSLSITVQDSVGNAKTQTLSDFTVESGVRIKEALWGPNPYNPRTGIAFMEYQLSQAAQVSLTLVALNGNVVWSQQLDGQMGALAGFNSVSWNGRDRFGDEVAAGPYILYIVAKKDGKTDKAKVKVMVLK